MGAAGTGWIWTFKPFPASMISTVALTTTSLTTSSRAVCGRRSKGTDSIGVGSFLQLMKTQSRVEHLASGRAVLSDKDSFQSRYA